MTVDYILTEKENPLDRGGAKKIYAQAVSNGIVTFDELSEEVPEYPPPLVPLT